MWICKFVVFKHSSVFSQNWEEGLQSGEDSVVEGDKQRNEDSVSRKAVDCLEEYFDYNQDHVLVEVEEDDVRYLSLAVVTVCKHQILELAELSDYEVGAAVTLTASCGFKTFDNFHTTVSSLKHLRVIVPITDG